MTPKKRKMDDQESVNHLCAILRASDFEAAKQALASFDVRLINEKDSGYDAPPLIWATESKIETQPFEKIQLLLNKGADPNETSSSKNTPLHLAARDGNIAICKLLLNKGGESSITAYNKEGETPLHLAMSNGFIELAVELFNACNLLKHPMLASRTSSSSPFGGTLLHYAVLYPTAYEIVSKLSVFSEHIEIRNHSGETPLLLAVRANQMESVKLLIERKADVEIKDYKGNGLLHYARREVLDWLYEKEYLLQNINFQNIDGCTPLHSAVIANNLDKICWLLNKGADFLMTDREGMTAMHFLAINCQSDEKISEEIATKLAEKDKNLLTIQDGYGMTPMHWTIGKELGRQEIRRSTPIANILLKLAIRYNLWDELKTIKATVEKIKINGNDLLLKNKTCLDLMPLLSFRAESYLKEFSMKKNQNFSDNIINFEERKTTDNTQENTNIIIKEQEEIKVTSLEPIYNKLMSMLFHIQSVSYRYQNFAKEADATVNESNRNFRVKLLKLLQNSEGKIHQCLTQVSASVLKYQKGEYVDKYALSDIEDRLQEMQEKLEKKYKQLCSEAQVLTKQLYIKQMTRLCDAMLAHCDVLMDFTRQAEPSKEQLLYDLRLITARQQIKTLQEIQHPKRPSCFISYAWGDAFDEKRVETLASDLKLTGFEVFFDKNDNKTGSVPAFVAKIPTVDVVILIATPELVEKWNNFVTEGESRDQINEDYRGNVVAQELGLIWQRLCKYPNRKLSGVLLVPWRRLKSAIPEILAPLAHGHLNFTQLIDYPANLFKLLEEITQRFEFSHNLVQQCKSNYEEEARGYQEKEDFEIKKLLQDKKLEFSGQTLLISSNSIAPNSAFHRNIPANSNVELENQNILGGLGKK